MTAAVAARQDGRLARERRIRPPRPQRQTAEAGADGAVEQRTGPAETLRVDPCEKGSDLHVHCRADEDVHRRYGAAWAAAGPPLDLPPGAAVPTVRAGDGRCRRLSTSSSGWRRTSGPASLTPLPSTLESASCGLLPGARLIEVSPAISHPLSPFKLERPDGRCPQIARHALVAPEILTDIIRCFKKA